MRWFLSKMNVVYFMREEEMKKTKAFVTYAWGDDEYNRKVYEFVARLRENGVDASCDKKEMQETSSPRFSVIMNKGLESDKVIVILSKEYVKKTKSDKSSGVKTEYAIISDQFTKEENRNKFIFVYFKNDDVNNFEEILPVMYKSTYVLSIEDNFEEILKYIYNHKTYDFGEVKDVQPSFEKIDLLGKEHEENKFHFKFTITEDRRTVSYDDDTKKQLLKWFVDKEQLFEVSIDDLYLNGLKDWFETKDKELTEGKLKKEDELDYQSVGLTIKSVSERNNDICTAINHFLKNDFAKNIMGCINYSAIDYLEICRNIILKGRNIKLQSDEKLISVDGIIKGFNFTAEVHENKIDDKELAFLSARDGRITTFDREDLIQSVIPSFYCYIFVYSTKKVAKEIDKKILFNLNNYIFGIS